MLPEAFRAALARDFPADFVTDDAAELAEYGRDWTKVVRARAVGDRAFRARPTRSRACSRCAARTRVPVVPSGGRTGLAGGAVAAHGELVLSLARMRRMDRRRRARRDGARAGRRGHRGGARSTRPRTGSPGRSTSRRRARAQVGGNIATNAGGVKVIRYGLTRQWVLGLAGGAGVGRGARAQRRAREEQHRLRSAPALHRLARARSASSPRRR